VAPLTAPVAAPVASLTAPVAPLTTPPGSGTDAGASGSLGSSTFGTSTFGTSGALTGAPPESGLVRCLTVLVNGSSWAPEGSLDFAAFTGSAPSGVEGDCEPPPEPAAELEPEPEPAEGPPLDGFDDGDDPPALPVAMLDPLAAGRVVSAPAASRDGLEIAAGRSSRGVAPMRPVSWAATPAPTTAAATAAAFVTALPHCIAGSA
jgi:hypothetical protein